MNRRSERPGFLVFVVMAVCLAACSGPSQSVTGTPTQPPATATAPYPGPQPTATKASTASPPPGAVQTVIPTTKGPTATYNYVIPGTPLATACVSDPLPGRLDQQPFSDYPQAILTYLNTGPSVSALDQALHDLGIGSIPISNAEADLSGDGVNDRVVAIFNPLSASMPPAGMLIAYICENGRYVQAYRLDAGGGQGAPVLHHLQDLNRDRLAEVVMGVPVCGASTCFEDLQVLSWDGAGFTNRLEGISTDLPFPAVGLSDDDDDGIFNVEVTSAGDGSAGAGPPRTTLRIWTYRPERHSWAAEADIPGASSYRIHVLHDAGWLVASGDLENAARLYQQVAADVTLMDWVDPAAEQANLGAYARFRLVVIFSKLSQPSFADAVLSEMDTLYPLSSPQRPYVDMARVFLAALKDEGIPPACQAARDYAADHATQILAPLGPDAFGYNAREFTPADVCEW